MDDKKFKLLLKEIEWIRFSLNDSTRCLKILIVLITLNLVANLLLVILLWGK